MHILYKITYLPHLQNRTPPYYYVGSKYNYRGNYFGSPSSKQKDWYTRNMSISDWWKYETKNNPKNFEFEIVKIFEDVTPQILVEEECNLHLSLDVKNSFKYFNKNIATKKWVSVPRTDETKEKMSVVTKKYWEQDNFDVNERKQKLIQYNKSNSSAKLKKTKKQNPEKFLMTEEKKNKLSSVMKNKWENGFYENRKKRVEKKVCIEGVVYKNAKEASQIFNIHEVNVRRRCRMSRYENWFYLED